MLRDIREIDSITFGLYSPEEIIKMSVCKIDSCKKSGFNTVYDPRMGTTDSSHLCETCDRNAEECPGHFGHIELNEPVVHPLYYKRVAIFLNCFCMKCYRLLITKDQIYLSGINKYKGEMRFNKIIEKLKKVDICCQPTGEINENGDIILCEKDKPKIKFTTGDNSYSVIYDEGKKGITSIMLTVEEIKKIFDNILPEDVILLGFDPELTHPRNFIISALPVCPPCTRPYVKADGKTCDDDLTIQYCEIIKANNNLAEDDGNEDTDKKRGRKKKDQTEQDKVKARASLRFRISTMFNNSQCKAKHTTNGRPIKGIKERLTGKEGQIRNNMMGKRALAPNTPILMWDGTVKRADEIIVGDKLIGDNGTMITVKHTLCGESPLYTVLQTYGNNYDISCEHILTLKFHGHCKILWKVNQGTYGGFYTQWYDRISKTCKSKRINITRNKTKDMVFTEMTNFIACINNDDIIDIHVKDYLSLPISKRRLMYGVKLSTPICWEHKKVNLDPRILGMMLGYDASRCSDFMFNSDLVKYWYTCAYGNDDGFNQTLIASALHEYNLNKHIPEEYIINDIETRRLVLAGLIDMNGTIDQENHTISISQPHEYSKIIYDAHKIVISLGLHGIIRHVFINTTREPTPPCTSLKLTIYGSGIEYIPTLLHQKKCFPCDKDVSCYAIDIIENGIGKFCGFEVDGNHRFLLGDGTITHNCDQTGRTVIGPDPTLKFQELGVPEEIAKILTVPIRATKFNIDILQEFIDNGKISSIVKPDGKTVIDIKRFRKGTRLMAGDIIYRGDKKISVVDGRELVYDGDKVERNGEILSKLKSANRKYELPLGWIVNRPLQNGDYVLLNRQPTLHKASMLAMQVVVKPHKTLRINLSITKGFNADFDGDEMNLHVPQSLEAQLELSMLSAAKYNIISPQSSKPNTAIVQDSLLGAYRMTQGMKKITKGQFFNIAMKLNKPPWSKYDSADGVMSSSEILDRIQHIRKIMKEKGKPVQCFTGRGIISLFLPIDFNYEKRNDKDESEPVVKIYRGVLYEGTLDKSILGSSHNAIHQVINKEYGPDAAAYFIDSMQFSTNNYLLIDGFTVGLGDCIIPDSINENGDTKADQIKDIIQKCYIEAENVKQNTIHPIIREIRVNAALNKAKDIGLRIAKEALKSDNNFVSTVNSGSKGDFFNVAQVAGLLGQQNLKGQRVPLLLNHGKRSLPHYPFGELPPEMEYESRGFIDRGFLKGLNPRQFYFHAMSGREGICDKHVSQTAGCPKRLG